jgi:hypothetical protein
MSIHASAEPFRFAAVGDGDPVGGSGPQERYKRRQLRFLENATRVVEDPFTTGPDRLDPDGPARVPRAYRTDGRWIWPEALRYYLDRHDVALPAAFADDIRAQGYWPPRVTAGRVGQARTALAGHAPGRYEPPAPDPGRFPPDVYDVLVTYGWRPDAPLAGLTIPVFGPGTDVPVVGFELFPEPEPGSGRAPAYGVLSGSGARIVRTGDGFHVLEEPVRFLGHDLDQTLVSLVRGHRP